MTVQHKSLAAGRWSQFSLVEQMAHVGSEVHRALSWAQKGNAEYSRLAYYRALELLDFTLADPKNRKRLKEPCRVRELLVDYFDGESQYGCTPENWRKYFDWFALVAARNR